MHHFSSVSKGLKLCKRGEDGLVLLVRMGLVGLNGLVRLITFLPASLS